MFKNYFSFSRRERNGIAVLSGIVIILLTLPFLYDYILPKAPAADFSQFKREIAQLQAGLEEEKDTAFFHHKEESITIPKAMFNFDPNTVTKEELIQLGTSEKTAVTIINYRNKGGHFKKTTDFSRIYGLSNELFNRLLPYITIQESGSSKPSVKKETISKPKVLMELNTADSAALEQLPGIGPVLASRIVKFRNRLGGFVNKTQLQEVYGLSKETYQKINTLITVDEHQTIKIDVNLDDIKVLGRHPYIGFEKAKKLIKYKKQHGQYSSQKDLEAANIFTEEELRKAMPYIELAE